MADRFGDSFPKKKSLGKKDLREGNIKHALDRKAKKRSFEDAALRRATDTYNQVIKFLAEFGHNAGVNRKSQKALSEIETEMRRRGHDVSGDHR